MLCGAGGGGAGGGGGGGADEGSRSSLGSRPLLLSISILGTAFTDDDVIPIKHICLGAFLHFQILQ